MLTVAELASARSAQNLTLTQTATIRRPSSTSDGMGGYTTTNTTVGTLPCRVAVASDSDVRQVASQLRERTLLRVTFQALADVRQADEVTINGIVYQVVGVNGSHTLETARACLCVPV